MSTDSFTSHQRLNISLEQHLLRCLRLSSINCNRYGCGKKHRPCRKNDFLFHKLSVFDVNVSMYNFMILSSSIGLPTSNILSSLPTRNV